MSTGIVNDLLWVVLHCVSPLEINWTFILFLLLFGAGCVLSALDQCWRTYLVFYLCLLSLSAGSYFARDAKYSSKFCHSTSKHNFTLQRHGLAPPIFQSDPPYKCMFLARVLVGEYTVGHPHFCRPPSKDLSIANFFDSCVDDMVNPKIFVIFDSNQIYPEYLIEFYWWRGKGQFGLVIYWSHRNGCFK